MTAIHPIVEASRARGAVAQTIKCRFCSAVLVATGAQRRKSRWVRRWLRIEWTGVYQQCDLCPACRAKRRKATKK